MSPLTAHGGFQVFRDHQKSISEVREADLWLDVAVFEQAFHGVEGMAGRELDPQAVQTLQSAVDLYRGGLQESWYQDWYLYRALPGEDGGETWPVLAGKEMAEKDWRSSWKN